MSSKEFYTSYKTSNEGGFVNNSTSTIFANLVRRDFGKKELPRVLDGSTNITAEKFENLPTVGEITNVTETAIRYHFGKVSVDAGKKELSDFGPNISTNPERVNKNVDKGSKNIVNQITLKGKCKDFSEELQRCLKLEGLNSVIIEGNWINPHFSLRTVGREGEIIIDPTVGQFLSNLKNVFVGTRGQLKESVLHHAKEGKLSFIDTSGVRKNTIPIRSDPEAFFEDQWPSLSNHRRFHSEEIISSPMIHPAILPSPVIQPNQLVKELRPIISRKII